MKVIKKDFVDENTISFCGKGKKLSSGTAYFLQKPNGEIVFGGKQCAKENSNTDLTQIPDFTKSLIARREGYSNKRTNENSTTNKNDFRKSKALTYMLLREEKLSEFRLSSKTLSYYVLTNYYKIYRENYDLTDKAVNHIVNIEKKLSNNILRLKNLSTCYAYKYILERTIVCLEKRGNHNGVEYVNGLKAYLFKNCYLTNPQIEGLRKWLKYLPKDLAEAKLEEFYI